jgi:DME family drug/metabolite transporter
MLDDSKTRSVSRGRLLIVAAALLWSTSGVIVKSPPLQQLMPQSERGPTIACYRAGVAAICLLPFVNYRRIRFRWALIPLVCSFAAMNWLFISAMTYTTAAAAIFLQYTSTFWAFLFGALLLKEPLERRNIVALGFASAGIAWIVAADWNDARFWGTLMGLGSGLAYGGVVVSLRVLREENGPWLIALCHVISCGVLLPWVLSGSAVPNDVQWSMIILLGVVQMAIPYVLFSRGLRYIPTQEAALIPLFEPICNPLWVWLIWSESIPGPTLIGGAMIAAGLLLRYTGGWKYRGVRR